ncbi:MAG TPA: ABC transporter permease [Saprospiraceae bacterium]|nr:ABC transporter permease [Saprospiraceae bacterium]
MTQGNGNDQWSTVISPPNSRIAIDLGELWHYRDLVVLLVRRDLLAVYKQTILGPLWFLLQPVVSTIVFTVVFGKIAGISTDGIPHTLFYMSGIIAWNYFTGCLSKTSDTFVANAAVFGKVYFPRLAVPISVVIVNILTFAIQFSLFLSVMLYFIVKGAAVTPNWLVLVAPLLILQIAALGLGIGIILSALTTKYRDLAFVSGFIMQLGLYVTPIVYPLSKIPSQWQWAFLLNPMTTIVETFRYAFLGVGSVTSGQTCLSVGITFFIVIMGIRIFSRMEKTFMDSV